MKLHAALARALAGHGVDTIFGLMGDANMFLVHSFVHEMERRYVAAAHEAGAMFMGFGYASLSGRLGVVTVTHGPALTNTVTGLVEAVRGRVPMLLIAGDTATTARGNIQDIAQRDVVLPTGAGFEQARTPDTALTDLAIAIRRAVVERRPIVFNVPSDHMWRDVRYDEVPPRLPPAQTPHPDPAAVRHAAAHVAAAQRPLVLAGRGAVAARAEVLALAARIGAPVVTTLKATGLFDGEPGALGLAGGLAAATARQVIEESDLLIAVGAGLNRYTTDNGALLTGRRVVVVDTAPEDHVAYDAVVRGDAAVVAAALIERLDAASVPATRFRDTVTWRLDRLGRPARRRPDTAPGTVDAETALRRLDEILPAQRVVVSDGGRFMMESLRHIRVPDPRGFVFPENFGSIGTGMGAAIGAATACPAGPVVLVCGDGGFMHGGIGEFATAVRENLDVIVVVCNDGGYGAEHVQFADRGLDPGLSLFSWPDLATVADALGGDGVTVRSADDLAYAEKAIADRTRPLLIDVRLDVRQMTPMPH
ncbi:thiamine pyrophosphate-binding protein [Catenuloplanes indicus]|uniref:Thiamine pyrophosphate-dependent acetolactate synthase large subunit-like protein n=1 Tax=Catenuloplanes indicus TaxID=137267 RepID=A0AAE3VXJ5_9ACTN|nr:thiamine pyrophosphate-binding protein [Catenuloplanes indicus]MDQ0365054.1 thiamine pyrophosphate-dependent acetolactate synthase large subunit-like protein [Catenuloplanes indicus]